MAWLAADSASRIRVCAHPLLYPLPIAGADTATPGDTGQAPARGHLDDGLSLAQMTVNVLVGSLHWFCIPIPPWTETRTAASCACTDGYFTTTQCRQRAPARAYTAESESPSAAFIARSAHALTLDVRSNRSYVRPDCEHPSPRRHAPVAA